MNRRRGFALLLGAAIVVAVGSWLALQASRVPLVRHFETLLGDLFTRSYFHVGDLPVTPMLVIELVVFAIVLGLISRRARAFIENHLLTHTSMDIGQRDALARLTAYVIFGLGLMIGLESLGVNLSSLLVLGGAVGIGVGLGLQNIANNFVSGLILLIERPVKLGDRVEVGGTNGDVVRIAGRSTWVRTNDNVVIIIPNSEFVSNRVTNWTANDRQVRFSVPLGVSYSSNPDEVRDVLTAVALAHPDVLRVPPPEVRFMQFGDSSLNFELRVWTIRQVQTPQILTSDLYFAIFRAFRERGIEIPFPQRDVHLKADAEPLPERDRGERRAGHTPL
ncbi:MAG TPA: mechanosensitive ion channel domain-containing protein [Terriglobia bacterium]|nr:mechanosensitive ion channel domain-containing protein [Terriglobia bacterium]